MKKSQTSRKTMRAVDEKQINKIVGLTVGYMQTTVGQLSLCTDATYSPIILLFTLSYNYSCISKINTVNQEVFILKFFHAI